MNDPFRALLRDLGGSRAIPTGMTAATGAGFEELLADLTDGNVSIWAPKVLADSGRADAGTGFFTVNPDGTSYRRHPDYFFFRQFMRYIRPGAVRLETTSNSPDVRAFGFEQANGRVLVLVNRASTPVNVWIRGLLPATCALTSMIGSQFVEGFIVTTGHLSFVRMKGNEVMTIRPLTSERVPVPIRWSASPGFVTLPTSTVALDALAEDAWHIRESAGLFYHWTVADAPPGANVTIDHPGERPFGNEGWVTPLAFANGLTVPGLYRFNVRMRGEDFGHFSRGPSVSRDVFVRAYAGNQPPVIAEGHRFFKQGWLVLPESSQTFGPDFIDAFDLEGDPLTTAFSVLSQPPDANARFSGSTVTGMTMPGEYRFRFTASAGGQVVTRDFVRAVIRASADKSLQSPGSSRRPRGPGAGGLSLTATPRTFSSPALPLAAAKSTLAASTPAAGIGAVLQQLWASGLLEGWQSIEVTDTDEDGQVDRLDITLTNGTVISVSLNSRKGHG